MKISALAFLLGSLIGFSGVALATESSATPASMPAAVGSGIPDRVVDTDDGVDRSDLNSVLSDDAGDVISAGDTTQADADGQLQALDDTVSKAIIEDPNDKKPEQPSASHSDKPFQVSKPDSSQGVPDKMPEDVVPQSDSAGNVMPPNDSSEAESSQSDRSDDAVSSNSPSDDATPDIFNNNKSASSPEDMKELGVDDTATADDDY